MNANRAALFRRGGFGETADVSKVDDPIVDDRLLLFWSGDFQGQPIDGLRNWESKFGDAGEERELLGRADRAWQELLSGSKKEKVVFFNPRDAERVNDARRAVGEKTYE